jgi:hypothetical protein
MPRGIYQRSEAQLEGMRERFRVAGAETRPSEEAKSRMSADRTKHGHNKRVNGKSKQSKTYQCWRNMLNRCRNPNIPAWKNYGGRGIVVCERWLKFENFLADMGERPDGMQIERGDNDGNYEPGNCLWATPKQQIRNRRVTRLMTLNGITQCVSDWGAELGVDESVIRHRLKAGWSDEKALTTPVRSARKGG